MSPATKKKPKAPKAQKTFSPNKISFLTFLGVKFTDEEKRAAWQRKYLEVKGKADAALVRLNELGADGSKLDAMIGRAQQKADAKTPNYEGACAELKDYRATARKAED